MRRLAGLVLVCGFLTGCHHRQPAARIAIALPPPVPVPLDRAPETPGVVPQVPVTMAPVTAIALPKKVKKPKKKPVPVVASASAAANAPVQVASVGSAVPASSVVGALTAGGEDPDTQKKATDLLNVLEKRLGTLPKNVVDKQPEQVARVKFFWSQAHAALVAGDVDGAWTLATKAKVLLDDVAQ